LLDDDGIAANIASIRRIFERFLTFGDGPTDAVMVNNADWLDKLEYIPFLRDVGRHFTINRMLDLRFGQAPPRSRTAADLPRIQLHDPPGL
jgi:tyrosyl-tRNA synthetase